MERYPAGGFGTAGTPQPPVVLVRGATVWTSAAQGRLEGADLLVRNGRIEAVGIGLDAPRDAVVVDAMGKHVTAGYGPAGIVAPAPHDHDVYFTTQP